MMSSICVRDNDLHSQIQQVWQLLRDSHAQEMDAPSLDPVICLTKGHADRHSDGSHWSKHVYVWGKHKSLEKEAMGEYSHSEAS
jgi:hypothetical protein